MRRGNDPTVIRINSIERGGLTVIGEHLLAFDLGSDACAEHECGFEDLKKVFGIPLVPRRRSMITKAIFRKDVVGIEARQITITPTHLRYFEIGDYSYLVYSPNLAYRNDAEIDRKYLDMLVEARDDEDLCGAWARGSFGIRVSAMHRAELKELYDAFKKKDVVICFGRIGVLRNTDGLILAIASRLPKEHGEALEKIDLDRLELDEATTLVLETTQLKNILKAAGKQYFALSPRWVKDIRWSKPNVTQYRVCFWLNPYDQRNNNCGYFTVEELLQWAEGVGPVLMQNVE